MIPLSQDTISQQDMLELAEWLKTFPRLTKGEKTIQFEAKWAKAVGSRYAVYVNSGSSANLLMIYALIADKRLKNKKVVIPSLSWVTDITPVMQFGLEPVLCDINLNDLSVDLKHLEDIFSQQQPAALMLVSILGLVPEMERITELCAKYGVILLEDICESLGSRYDKKLLGNFGLMSSCSLYYAHQLSTVEGGIITTDDEDMYDLLKMLRSHGWDRDVSPAKQKKLRDKWGTSDFNALYTFYQTGFNVRATDLQAFIGLRQLDRLHDIVTKRHDNYVRMNDLIENDYWKPKVTPIGYVSNLGYPVLHPKRKEIVTKLMENQIEVRPLISGSMGVQPFFIERYGRQELPNAAITDQHGFYIPNHPYLTAEEIELMCSVVNEITAK